MADVTGQIQRKPGVCVATLGPGAVNMTLGVANAFLDRSPLVAVTATMSASASPYATHQNLDLNAVYRPFTKMAITLDGHNTAAKVRRALRESMAPRMGPVHIAVPSDIARLPEHPATDTEEIDIAPPPAARVDPAALARVAEELKKARRPVLILGLDLDPYEHATAVRAFAERLGVPVFVTPKGKGLFPEDHRLFWRHLRGCGRRQRDRRVLQEGRPARRARVRAGGVRQALAPRHEARLDRPRVHRRRQVQAARRGRGRCRARAVSSERGVARPIRVDRRRCPAAPSGVARRADGPRGGRGIVRIRAHRAASRADAAQTPSSRPMWARSSRSPARPGRRTSR